MAGQSNENQQTASCACGAISVRLSEPPVHMMLCCCADCQKAGGSGHSAFALMRGEAVEIDGAPRSFSVTAASGATTTRYFCGTCGTPIFGQSSRAAPMKMIPAGLFGAGIGFAPKSVIFARSHLDWDVLPDDIPQYDTYKST